MKKNFDIKKVMEWLGMFLKCPVCGTKYNMRRTNIVDTNQNDIMNQADILIHSDCSKCKSSVMFNIEINGPEVFSAAMITDLTGTDSTRFKNKKPISSNEIIGIHQALKGFKGDFVKEFSGK